MSEEHLGFYDSRDSDQELEQPFKLEKVEAGKEESRIIFVENELSYNIDLQGIKVVGNSDQVAVEEVPKNIPAGERMPVNILFTANTAKLEPIEFTLEVEYSFVTD